MTPGMMNGRRKNVAFGKEVVDNEGKKPMQPRSKTGLPTDCPGKFPSPFTPKEKQFLDARPATSRDDPTQGTTATSSRTRSKDDADITLDVMEPRSESGQYWKELHISYAEQSEKEVKRLIAKQKLAKQFAKGKDREVSELKDKLNMERKKNQARENEWDQQMKDMKERLRTVMAENTKYATEVAILRQQLEAARSQQRQTKPNIEVSRQSLDDRFEALRSKTASAPTVSKIEVQARSDHPSTKPASPKRTSTTSRPVRQAEAVIPTLSPVRKADANMPKLLSPSPLRSGLFLSSDDKPFSSPTATATFRSANSYRVSKRPVTLTTVRERKPQRTPEHSKKQEVGAFEKSEKLVSKLENDVDQDENLDLWNISDLESSTPAGAKLNARLARGMHKDKAIPKLAESTTPKDPPKSSSAATTSLPRSGTTGPAVDFPALLTKEEKAANSPRHFPGSPAVRPAPLEASVGAGNSKSGLPSDKETAAKARLAAKKMGRQMAMRSALGDTGEKENVLSLLDLPL